MIRDLLPLYIDEVCSDESRKIVEDHIKECPECASLTDSMRNDEAVNGAEDYESAQVRSLRNVRKKTEEKSVYTYHCRNNNWSSAVFTHFDGIRRGDI
nr:zf-HC2 domain-containing protein [Ruminococcus sp. HUN007]